MPTMGMLETNSAIAGWRQASASMLAAGFCEVSSANPYWQRDGKSFADHDGYRVVLQHEKWSNP